MNLLTLLIATSQADTPWHLDVTAGTDFPISVGLETTVEAPSRLRGKFGVGLYPQPYLDLLNNLAVSQDWWDENTATLIDAALTGALVTSAQVGWRPWEDRRFSFGVGYQLIALGGGLTDAELLQAVTGKEVSSTREQVLDATIGAQLHQLSADVSWQWQVRERFIFSAQVGGLSTLYSNTAVDVTLSGASGPADDATEAGISELETYSEDYLDGLFQTWVHTGTIGIYVGYRFF